VAKFQYLVKTVTTTNLINEEFKSILNLGNVCYHSVQNLSSSWLLSKYITVAVHKTKDLPVVLYWCETWPLALRAEHRLKVFDNRVLRRI
jgi:hypothetical protein